MRTPGFLHTFLSRFIPLALITVLAFAYLEYTDRAAKPEPTLQQGQEQTPFQCDGRKQCAQMSSCAEARYFLKNCPGTEMDQDGDGVPCQPQLCQ